MLDVKAGDRVARMKQVPNAPRGKTERVPVTGTGRRAAVRSRGKTLGFT
jgi:hypothetical protein